MSGNAGVGGVWGVGEGKGGGEGCVCGNSDTTAGGSTSGYECRTLALDPWYPNKSLSLMSVFSFCTLTWWLVRHVASRLISEVGRKYSSRVTAQLISRLLR